MGTFTLSNGKSFEIEGHNGPVARILIGRKYNDPAREDIPIPDEYLSSSDVKVEKKVNLISRDDHTTFTAIDTYALAVNKEYQEFETVEEYDGQFSMNTRYKHKIEVILKADNWTKRLFLEWHGEGGYGTNFFNYIKDLPEKIIEEAIDGDLEAQGIKWDEEDETIEAVMYTGDGDSNNISLSEHELEATIVSVRLIEFECEIIGG